MTEQITTTTPKIVDGAIGSSRICVPRHVDRLVRSAAKSQLICPVKQSTKIEFSARSRTPGVGSQSAVSLLFD
jgi:hypothetical protein